MSNKLRDDTTENLRKIAVRESDLQEAVQMIRVMDQMKRVQHSDLQRLAEHLERVIQYSENFEEPRYEDGQD